MTAKRTWVEGIAAAAMFRVSQPLRHSVGDELTGQEDFVDLDKDYSSVLAVQGSFHENSVDDIVDQGILFGQEEDRQEEDQ